MKKITLFLKALFFVLFSYSGVFGQTNPPKYPHQLVLSYDKSSSVKLNAKFWKEGGVFYGRIPDDEHIDKRTRISKTFNNQDGTKTILFAGLTHYKDETGKWQEINNTITQNNSGKNSSHKYANTSAEIKSYFPEIPGKGIFMNYNNEELSFGYDSKIRLTENGNIVYSENASPSATASIAGNKLSYHTIYEGMNEEFIVLENGQGIKNNIIVNYLSPGLSAKSNNADLEVYQFIPLDSQWKVYNDSTETNKDFISESFLIKKGNTSEGFVFNPIIVYDNAIRNDQEALALFSAPKERWTPNQKALADKNIISGKYKIHFVKGGIEISYVVNHNWFTDAARKFPVTIDPSITIGSGQNTTSALWNGYYSDVRSQVLYLASDFTNAGMGNGDIITAIGLNHAYYSGDCTGSHTGLKIRMKNTTSSSFSSSSFSNTGYTSTYSGTQSITTTTGWYAHTLSTTYTFNSTQNIIMDFSQNRSSYMCASNQVYFNSWTASANRRIYSLDDYDIGDPQTYYTSGTLSTKVPYTQVTYSSGSAPINDNCSGAIELGVNSVCDYTEGTSENATQSISGCTGNADDDVWYKFVAIATTATVTINPSATYDPVFELRSGACNGTQISGSCTDVGGDNGNETFTTSALTIGNTYYIRVWDYGIGSGSNLFDICVIQPCNPPVTSASAIAFSGVGCTQMTVSWTNGSGNNRIVVAKAGSTVSGLPTDNVTYAADASFGSGSTIASGEYVVYNGSANTVNLTDLAPGTTYHFKVFEYSCPAGTENYKTASPPLNSQATSSLPVAAGTISGTASVAYGQTAVAYSVGAISGATSYAWSYTASGFTCASGCTSNSMTADFSCSTASGNLTVYGTNACGNGVASSAYAITVDPPSTSASSITFSGVTCTQMTVNWTNGNGSKRIVVIKAGSAVSGTPANNMTYTANTSFGSGSTIATGEYVIYNNTSNSVTVTSLSPGTTYHFKVFEYTCSAGSEKYKTTSPPLNSQAAGSLPNAAGAISGTASVSEGQTAVAYSAGAITGATSYVWTYTATGFTCASGCTSNSMTADFSCSASSGNLTVYGTNTCGNGTASPAYAITVNSVAAIPGGPDQYICSASTTATMAAASTGTWTKISGGSATITTPSSSTTTITGLASGTYVFRWANGCAYDDVVIIKQ